jgi:anti-sigma factor ChrR (cupin superfamily)
MTTLNAPSQIILVSDKAWTTVQPWGVRIKSLWSDPPTKRRVNMTRFNAGAVPAHKHLGDELIFVLEGVLSDEAGTVTAGNAGYRPIGCAHNVSTSSGATILTFLNGDFEPANETGDSPSSRIINVNEMKWSEPSGGIRHKPIWEDEMGERRFVLAQLEAGASLPRHRHIGDELVFVLEGSIADESGEVASGNMSYRPNGCVHAVTTKNGATVLASIWGKSEPVKSEPF